MTEKTKEELKTLKDLEKAIRVGDVKKFLDEENKVRNEWMTSVILAGDLKAEAVKWVKNTDYFIVNAWIKHFFNLTEEDFQ